MNNQADSLRYIVQQMKNNIRSQINRTENVTSTRVITISSGKGGVGKSNISLNLALALTEFKQKVMLLDADLGLANIDIILGIRSTYNLADVIRGEKTITEVIIEGPKGLKIIPGGSGMQELANLKDWQLENFLTKLSSIEGETDYLIIDTGAGLSKTVTSFALAAEEIIIVTTSEPTAITDAYGFIKTLSQQHYEGRVYLLVNRVASFEDAGVVFNKLKIAINRFLKYKVEYLGFINEDPKVLQAIKEQQAFIVAYPQCKASQNIYQIAAKITNQEYQPKQEKTLKTFFKNVVKYFR
ncbi:MAG: MinD/ParA family protein [Clostridia bacterium]|nr:MinD/ParA family protein [Clostridia bacterium]MDD4047608.1 MinD/ParA family protein [Clostridia bacterium]